MGCGDVGVMLVVVDIFVLMYVWMFGVFDGLYGVLDFFMLDDIVMLYGM